MKIFILGAGPSGLGVAWELTEQGFSDIVILEKSSFVGGLSSSIIDDEVTLDIGPHRLSPEFPEVVSKIKSLLGEDLLEEKNLHGIFFKNKVYQYPPKFSDFCDKNSIRFGSQAVISFLHTKVKTQKDNKSFEGILEKRFGSHLFNEVLSPMVEKVWGNPEKIDPEFANLRFTIPSLRKWMVKLVKKNHSFNDKVFFYPRHGYRQIWDTLKVELEKKGVQFLLNTVAEEVLMKGNRVTHVSFKEKEGRKKVACDWLVSTIPVPAFVDSLSPCPRELASIAKENFKVKGMLMPYFLINKEKTLPARVIIFPEKKFSFNRLTEQNQFSRSTVPAKFSAITADVLTEKSSLLWGKKDADVLNLIENELLTCRFFKKEEVIKRKLYRFEEAYPLPFSDREKSQEELNRQLGLVENLICTGRFASSDYNNSHSALKKGFLAATAIINKSSPDKFYKDTELLRKTPIRD